MSEVGFIETARNEERLKLLRMMGWQDNEIIEDAQENPTLYDNVWVCVNRKA